jgi:hypothetical protein
MTFCQATFAFKPTKKRAGYPSTPDNSKDEGQQRGPELNMGSKPWWGGLLFLTFTTFLILFSMRKQESTWKNLY